jgi:hypothetical protein
VCSPVYVANVNGCVYTGSGGATDSDATGECTGQDLRHLEQSGHSHARGRRGPTTLQATKVRRRATPLRFRHQVGSELDGGSAAAGSAVEPTASGLTTRLCRSPYSAPVGAHTCCNDGSWCGALRFWQCAYMQQACQLLDQSKRAHAMGRLRGSRKHETGSQTPDTACLPAQYNSTVRVVSQPTATL